MEIPFGYCHCGCGRKTNIATRTVPRLGFIKGQPHKFLCGHGRVSAPVGSTPPPNPAGLCQCGCGKQTPLAIYTSHQTGNVIGEHRRFFPGHGSSHKHYMAPQNGSGLCMCGCGEKTPLSPLTRTERGYAAGQPMNFIHNHHGRRTDYVVEDRGYKTPCWVWQKALDSDGYGKANLNRKPIMAHRLYYSRFKGAIPPGWQPDHLCFVRCCVNPDHLEAVPPIVNQRRKRTVKLTLEKLALIAPLRAAGLSYAKIANELGVTSMAVYNAHKGRTWVGVLDPLILVR